MSNSRNTPPVGTRVEVPGLDMQCRPTIESYTVVRVLDEPRVHTSPVDGSETRLDCVIESAAGFRSYADSSTFVD